jgi:histidyl-tRNA synthetase
VLDEEAREKRATSPLRVFDVKSERVQAALADAPKIGESLCDACREHFASVRAHPDAYGIGYRLEPTLVRGLDYYTRTAWEFVGPEAGAQSALSGGGRYDGLVEEIGGPPTPGIGFGAGLERLLLALEQEEVAGAARPGVEVFFVCEDGADRLGVARALATLRGRGVSADMDYAGRSVKGQFTQASRLDARTIVVVDRDGARIRRPGGEERVALEDVAEAL